MTADTRAAVENKARFWFCGIWISMALVLVSPVLGLLGTVTGMVQAFDNMGLTGGVTPEGLAENISLALMTTAGGLAVSAVALVFFFVALVRYLVLSRSLQAPTID